MGIAEDQYNQAMRDAAAKKAAEDQKEADMTPEEKEKAAKESQNGYVAAAGVALKTVGMADQAMRAQEQKKIDSYNQKIMAKRAGIRNMFS